MVLAVLVTCGYQASASAADTLLLVKDLEEEWLVNREEAGLVPVLDKKEFSGNILFVPVNAEAFKGTRLVIETMEDVSLFRENSLIDRINGRREYNLDSLREQYGESFIFTLYRNQLNPYRISTGIYREVEDDMLTQMQSEQVLISSREQGQLRDVMLVSLFIVLSYIAALFLYYPKVTQEFLKVSRGFSLREVDENLMKTRPLSSVNLLFYGFYSMLGAWVLLILAQLSGMHLRLPLFQFDSFWGGMITWLELSFILLAIIFIKYILVSSFKTMFSIPGFLNNHYYNYIRIGMVMYLSVVIFLIIAVFTFGVNSESFYYSVVFVLCGLYFMRAGVIYFKLMNSASYSILHLFSYLCATELMPFMLIVALAKYQPF